MDYSLIMSTKVYDINCNFDTETSEGWKISIQGWNHFSSMFLIDKLESFLFENKIPFKVATIKRYDLRKNTTNNSLIEQSHKAMTIYCPNGTYIFSLCEDIYNLIIDYRGWNDIKTPSSYKHYAGAIFYRNDRDENGEYVPAN